MKIIYYISINFKQINVIKAQYHHVTMVFLLMEIHHFDAIINIIQHNILLLHKNAQQRHLIIIILHNTINNNKFHNHNSSSSNNSIPWEMAHQQTIIMVIMHDRTDLLLVGIVDCKRVYHLLFKHLQW